MTKQLFLALLLCMTLSQGLFASDKKEAQATAKIAALQAAFNRLPFEQRYKGALEYVQPLQSCSEAQDSSILQHPFLAVASLPKLECEFQQKPEFYRLFIAQVKNDGPETAFKFFASHLIIHDLLNKLKDAEKTIKKLESQLDAPRKQESTPAHAPALESKRNSIPADENPRATSNLCGRIMRSVGYPVNLLLGTTKL